MEAEDAMAADPPNNSKDGGVQMASDPAGVASVAAPGVGTSTSAASTTSGRMSVTEEQPHGSDGAGSDFDEDDEVIVKR